MAEFISLILGSPRRVRLGVGAVDPEGIGVFEFDVSLFEDHTESADVTQFPVESGSDIADHIRPRPAELSITGVITDTPLTVDFQTAGSGLTSVGTRAGDAFKALRDIMRAGELIDVVTTLRTYEDMAITSVKVPRDAERGGRAEITVTLRQVFTAEIATVPLPEPEPGRGNTKGPANVGEKQAKTPTEAEDESLAFSVLSWAGVPGF